MRALSAWLGLAIGLGLGTGCAVYPPAVFCAQDADCEGPGAVCDLEIRRCRSPQTGECTDKVASQCLDGIVYWVDSCGRLGELRETCDCGCRDEQSCEPCECERNEDCAHLGRNHYCNPFTFECDCAPDCGIRCCGDDGCGGECPGACPPETRCGPDCICVPDCQPQTCAGLDAFCGRQLDGCGGWLECGPETICQDDWAMACDDGHWAPQMDCTLHGQTCQDGACAGPALCPDGLGCQAITDQGLLGCTLADGSLPPDSQTGCQGLCDAPNQYCHQAAYRQICVLECGACPADQLCLNVSNDYHVCLVQDADGNIHVPLDAPTGCWDPQDCPGNRMCWCLDANCAETVCLENCTPPQ